MNLLVFGASGLVGASVLREALADADVATVLSVGRRPSGVSHPKLREVLVEDLFDVASVEPELAGCDACVWAIGISSSGLDEAAYARTTVELTLLWADALLRANPRASFCYCSGAGADGPVMWARVRRNVEDALKAMPFVHSGVVRPGFIRPGRGLQSRTAAYRIGATLMAPLFFFESLLLRLIPFVFTTSEILGRAMLRVVKGQADKYILESGDINRVGR